MAEINSSVRFPRGTDLTGKVFGKLTVITRADKASRWLCRCSCGVEKTIARKSLTRGATRSCGCLMTESRFTHNKTNTKEHRIWIGMRNRCRNLKKEHSHRYIGRGIKVCDRWEGRNGFANFIADMGPIPSDDHTIERKNNDGDYCPENCVWATRLEQSKNTSLNHFITFNGETLHIQAWARKIGISGNSLRRRLKYWSLEKAMTTPNQRRSSEPGIV